jgi:hypothetical protein
MIYGTITAIIFMAAIAYTVLVLANKEAGNMKLAGQVIAVLIALIMLVVLFYGVTGKGHCGMMGKGMMGGGGMMGGNGMMMEGKGASKAEAMKSMMKEMCKDPATKKMMQDVLKTAK